MATRIVEPVANGEFLHFEEDTFYTRGRGLVFKSQAANAFSGTLVGMITKGAQTAVGAAFGGNVGNGVISGVSASPFAEAGPWTIVVGDTVANAGAFELFDPSGEFFAVGKIGVAHDSKADGGIAFLIPDGSSDAVSGDRWKVTVAYAAAGGDVGKIVPMSLTASDGSQNFYGALVNTIPGSISTGSATDKRNAQAVVRGKATFYRELIIYPAGATDGQKKAIDAQMAAKGFFVTNTVLT